MKKKIFTFLCFIFMSFGMFTGCSGFVVDDESLYISNITSQVLEDGTTMVTIIYTDDEIEAIEDNLIDNIVPPLNNKVKAKAAKNSRSIYL